MLDRVAHIRALGVTTIMLSSPFLSGTGDGPFGRAPYSFFAPELAWVSGSDPLAPVRELKELVRGLHAQGIEVWLQVSRLYDSLALPASFYSLCFHGSCKDWTIAAMAESL